MQERYHRDSQNDLTLTVTMDDPKLYTGTFFLGETHFRWIPNQRLYDFTCIPSSTQMYIKEMGDPAGSDPDTARGRGRGRGPKLIPATCDPPWASVVCPLRRES